MRNPERDPHTRRPPSRARRPVLIITLCALCAVLTRPAPGSQGVLAGPAQALVRIALLEDQRVSGPELLSYVGDPDPAVRGRVALALGRIGRPEDVGALSGLLADSQSEVRRSAAFGLGLIQDSTSANSLAPRCDSARESDPEVRALAVEGLGKLRTQPETCRRALDDPSAMVKAQALLAAWKIPMPGVLEAVLRLSSEPDPEVRWPAAYCLMRLLGAPPSGRTPIPSASPLPEAERTRAGERLRALTADLDVRVRLHSTRGLGSFGDSATTRLLLDLCRDSDWRVRVEAVRALASPPAFSPGRNGNDEDSRAARGPAQRETRYRTVPWTALETLLLDPNPNVRITAVEALGRLGTAEEAFPRLHTLLEDALPRVRQVAFGTLLTRYRETGDPLPSAARSEVEALTRRMLGEKDWTLRALTADGCALLPPEQALPILQSLLRDDPRVTEGAVVPFLTRRAQGRGGPLLARLRPELDWLIRDRDPVVRATVVGALQEILGADSVAAAVPANWTEVDSLLHSVRTASLAQDSTSDVRLAAVELAAAQSVHPLAPALGEAKRLLLDACSDPNYLVRRAACAAVDKLGITPLRGPEPVETGRQDADYAAILKWAGEEHWAVIETDGGRIVVRLLASAAPLTCWSFRNLAQAGFYDHGRWHRVVPDFVLQGGCPRGDGAGGPSYELRCEYNRERYRTGTLGMALSGKDTGGSQFFLTHSDQPHLDGRYTVFGRMEEGQEVADLVVQGSPIRTIRVVEARP